jgi:hypothetical protein
MSCLSSRQIVDFPTADGPVISIANFVAANFLGNVSLPNDALLTSARSHRWL